MFDVVLLNRNDYIQSFNKIKENKALFVNL